MWAINCYYFTFVTCSCLLDNVNDSAETRETRSEFCGKNLSLLMLYLDFSKIKEEMTNVANNN